MVGTVGLGVVGVVLGLAAVPQISPVLLIAAVLAFYVTATGVAVVLHAEAGSGGSRRVASYVTASDFGSAAGPNLGWLLLQLGGQLSGPLCAPPPSPGCCAWWSPTLRCGSHCL